MRFGNFFSIILSITLFGGSSLAFAGFEWISPVHVSGQMGAWNQRMLSQRSASHTAECAQILEVRDTFLCQNFTRSELNLAFLRASIFVEGGSGIEPGTIISLHDSRYLKQFADINGHDLKSKDLLAFYRALKKSCKQTKNPDFCPIQEEKDLYSQVIKMLSRNLNHFVLISFVANEKECLETVSHEVFHAQFFTQEKYEAVVRNFWSDEVSKADRQAVKHILKESYNPDDEYLMMNEFQAYILEMGALNDELAEFVRPYREKLYQKLADEGVAPIQVK